MRRVFLALLCAAALGCAPDDDAVRRIVKEEMGRSLDRKVVAAAKTIGPYSPAIRVGNFLFVSGQIGLDEKSGLLRNETFEAETRQTLENVSRLLRAEGYDSSHVVSATVYLRSMEDYHRMNLIYGGYFPESGYPARATVAVSGLPRDARVEIAVVAYRND